MEYAAGMKRPLLALAALCALPLLRAQEDGIGPPPAGRHGRTLELAAPDGWKPAPLQEGERQAFYVPVPTQDEAEGDPEVSEPRTLRVSVYRLGPRPRPLQEQVARWARSFLGEDGRPLAPAAARVKRLSGAPFPTHLVRLEGTYRAPRAPGAEEEVRRPGWAGLHAHLVAPDGTSTVILVGPRVAVAALEKQLVAFLRSAELRVGATADPREAEGRDVAEDE